MEPVFIGRQVWVKTVVTDKNGRFIEETAKNP